MKKVFLSLVLVLFLAFSVNAADVTLMFQWDQTDYERVTAWNLWTGDTAGGPYTLVQKIPKEAGGPAFTSPEIVITSPAGQKKTHYFVITALDEDNNQESAYSNEIFHEINFIPVPPPASFTVIVIVKPN